MGIVDAHVLGDETIESKGSTVSDFVKEQAPPEDSTGPAIWDLVVEDMRSLRVAQEEARAAAVADMFARDGEGFKRYGKRLRAFNGRDALIDAYQEALDKAVYLRQKIEEQADGASDTRVLRSIYEDELRSILRIRNLLPIGA